MTVEIKYEIAVPLFGTGRRFKLFSITKKTTIMAAETKLVKIKITDAFGIAYAKGKVYEVTPEEAQKLIKAQKAIAHAEDGKETASAKNAGAEKR